MVTPSRSATAMTEASTVPRPRSSYVSTSSGGAFDVDVTDVLHLEATRLGAAEEVAFGPRLGATRGWVPDLGDHEIGGAGEAHWPHRRRRPVAVGEALPPVGVDAALAGVIFASDQLRSLMRQVIRRAFRSQRSRSSSATGPATDRGYGTPRSVRRSTESVSSRSRISAFPDPRSGAEATDRRTRLLLSSPLSLACPRDHRVAPEAWDHLALHNDRLA